MNVLLAGGLDEERKALRYLLEQDSGLRVVGELVDAAGLLEQVVKTRPSLLVIDWDTAGIQEDLGRIGGPPSHLFHLSGDLVARRVGLYHQEADAPGAFSPGSHCTGQLMGPKTAGDEHFASMDHIMIALPHGCGLKAGHVGSALGFGYPQSRDLLTLEDRGHESGFLPFGT